MYARSTTFRGDPSAIDDGIAYTRDKVLPAVQQMDGCVGLSMLVDRRTGRCITTTAWEDAEAMHNSAEAIRSIREKAVAAVHGVMSETEVAEWEVGVVHRLHPAPEGAAARVIWTQGAIGASDRIIEGFRAYILPRVAELPGFCSIALLLVPSAGRAAIAAVSTDGRRRHCRKGQGQPIRREFTERMGRHTTDVEELAVALPPLRAPEPV